jgi:frataxin-like iron-binding protein CyaY
MSIFDSDAEKIKKIVSYWEPEVLTDEIAYKKSLTDYLKKKLSNIHTDDEFEDENYNIVIDDKILVIIKNNITELKELYLTSGEFQYHIDKWNGDIILVICGRIKREFFDYLKKYENLPILILDEEERYIIAKHII